MKPCVCTAAHNPKPLTTDSHHVVPLSWNGPDTADNRVQCCPTTHHSTHALIDLYVHLGRPPTTAEMRAKFGVLPSRYMRDLATQAWAGRPPNPTPTSLTHFQTAGK